MNALEMYDQIVAASQPNQGDDTKGITDKMASTTIGGGGEVARLQEKQRAAIEAHKSHQSYDSSPERTDQSHVHPDLEDLDFGSIGASSSKLPPPMRPKKVSDDSDEDDSVERRGSLSDFSDYESSDEETHRARAGSSTHQRKKSYVTVSDNDSLGLGDSRVGLTQDEDPFADPFADSAAVRN
jgi:LAS seventeen-binding protein 5